MSNTANFAATPRSEVVQVSAANTNRDGTGTIVSGFTSGAQGSRLDRIEIKAVATTNAGMVRAFKKDGAGPWELWREYTVSAATPTATAPSFSVRDNDLLGAAEILKAGMQVGFSTHNAESFRVHLGGGDF